MQGLPERRRRRAVRDISVGWGPAPAPVAWRDPRHHRRMRSEKSHQDTGGRGFDSRHLHPIFMMYVLVGALFWRAPVASGHAQDAPIPERRSAGSRHTRASWRTWRTSSPDRSANSRTTQRTDRSSARGRRRRHLTPESAIARTRSRLERPGLRLGTHFWASLCAAIGRRYRAACPSPGSSAFASVRPSTRALCAGAFRVIS